MNIRKAKRAISAVAQREGVSEQEILAEIEKAMEVGLETAKRQGNEQMLQRWKTMMSGEVLPDAYTLVACLAERLKNGSGR